MPSDFLQWVLTDLVHADKWLDSFSLTSAQIPGHHQATPWKITKRTLQGGLRQGVDAVELDNGAFQITILPTRGMGLWLGNYRGIRLGWDSPVHGPVHPSFVRQEERGGLGWLQGFDEWICRCGLGSNGPPGDDRGQRLTLHGRIANQPAHFVGIRVLPEPPYTLQVVGRLQEASLFGGNLHLTTVLSTTPGSNVIEIHDRIENRSAQTAEFQLLYHCNFGPPLLGPGSKVIVPAQRIAPRDTRAAGFIDRYETYAQPLHERGEIVNFYQPRADDEGRALAILHNQERTQACALRFNVNNLPWFSVWKNIDDAKEGYVTGLEPATNFPNFKAFERQQGRVLNLAPGASWDTTLLLEAHADQESIEKLLVQAAHLQGGQPPQISEQTMPDWSPNT